MTRSAATLHITNGDSVLYVFKKAGILGRHLGWRDALHEGPVPAGLTLTQTSVVRAQYIAERGYAKPIKIIAELGTRDNQILKAGEFQEVVLWFEHDLYDQLQLLQVLTTLEGLTLDPGRVTLVQSDHYLGTMTADELSPLLSRRRTATAATFKSARRAWDRFTSPSPADLLAAAAEDAIGLPFLRAALQRLCEEYPLRQDGLSRSQRHALAAVAQGCAETAELYERAQAREEAHFLGDAAFAKILDDLADERAPLLRAGARGFELTALGREVLSGEADWLDTYPIDRWIGGVHLTGGHVIRWDEDGGRFVEA
ncbi:MAG: hypothetical protein JOY69_05265 [Candidatus Eremiobacteraeota bacterium]|nr:hypothetical protein [Candidatus Eremiobacteraeota bacterium]